METIVNSRRASRAKSNVEYLIKWLDYEEEENTWEPVINLMTPVVQELIKHFHSTHPHAYRFLGRKIDR